MGHFKLGGDAADPRYVRVGPSPLLSLVFRPEDDPVLETLVIDGTRAEPRIYYPTIPLALANGASGIGWAHRASFPSFDPRRIIRAMRVRTERAISHDEWVEAIGKPFYAGFTGSFEAGTGKSAWICRGVIERDGSSCNVTEIPIGTCILAYAHHLKKLESAGKLSGLVDLSKSNVPLFQFESTLNDKALGLVESLAQELVMIVNDVTYEFSMGEFCEAWYAFKIEAMNKRKAYWEMQMAKKLVKEELTIKMLHLLMDGTLKVRLWFLSPSICIFGPFQ